mgnify:CR=1 FL=1
MIKYDSVFCQTLWETGKVPCPILDFHGHMHSYVSAAFPAAEPHQMMETMNRCGTRWLFFCSHLAMYDPVHGEAIQREAVQTYPDRMKAYHSVITTHADPDGFVRDMETYPEAYVGCKFLADYYRTPMDDDRNRPYLEYLDEHGLLALIHTWGGSLYSGPERIAKLAERYTNVTFICGHSFSGDFDHAYDLLKDLPNVYFEFTAVPRERGFIELICEKAGSQRLLFGTDLPWFGTLHGVGSLATADITDLDRENILYRNGDRLLRRFKWYTGL